LSFGDTALIITDSVEFIKRVNRAANIQGYESHFGAAQYYEPSEDSVNMIASLLKGMWNIAFWKRKHYAYQQEGRFVFTPGKETLDHIELDIGDISDISIIVPASTALNSMVDKDI
jgi:hypothetical protein